MWFSADIFPTSIAVFFVLSLCACSCTHLPEQDMSTTEIIEYYGYPAEIHDVTTADGYILQIHRIPFGIKEKKFTLNSNYKSPQRPVFFLQHGLLATSADWLLNLPNQSLGFLLADAGFDVWLGNVRGNWYSNKHINCSISDSRYWQFTWDEMAEHDLPAMLNTALEISRQQSLYYVGHSQGTEIMFAKLASDPKFAKKIHKFFALAPVSSVSHIRGLLSWIGKYLGSYIWLIEKLFGSRDFLPQTWLSRMFASIICGERWIDPLCNNVLFQIGGPEKSQFNQTRLLVYMSHTPAGTSTWNILHWAQMYRSKTVQKFDFGSRANNQKHYGQDIPPFYNLTRINAPIYLYYSESDWLGDAADVRASLLAVVPKEFVKLDRNLPSFNHFDFLWGLNAPKEIYSEIIDASQKHSHNLLQQAQQH